MNPQSSETQSKSTSEPAERPSQKSPAGQVAEERGERRETTFRTSNKLQLLQTRRQSSRLKQKVINYNVDFCQKQLEEERNLENIRHLANRKCNLSARTHLQTVPITTRRRRQSQWKMLSKIKAQGSAAAAAATATAIETRYQNSNQNSNSSSTSNTNANSSDNEHDRAEDSHNLLDGTTTLADSDSNNNNNNTTNVNNNNSQPQQQAAKKSQDELMDIVEVSRKRRLSKDSADSLTSFIRWSFGHIDRSAQRVGGAKAQIEPNNNTSSGGVSTKRELDELLADEEPVEWSAAAMQSAKQQQQLSGDLLRQHAVGNKLCGGSSAANLSALQQQLQRQVAGQDSAAASTFRAAGAKRLRTHLHPVEGKFLGQQAPRKGYLGNVVERLHQQQQMQQQQQLQQQQQQQHEQRPDGEDSAASGGGGLSFHLQQFLQQQTSLEDLCSSVGLDESNQLVLAAAIHRALVDSVGPNAADTKSTASSTGSSSGGSSQTTSASLGNQSNGASSGATAASLHLVDSFQRQRRAYNTRAALHGLAAAAAASNKQQQQSAAAAAAHHQTRQSSVSAATALAAMNMSNRAQQQRHAQAAAALSALASAGSHGAAPTTNQPLNVAIGGGAGAANSAAAAIHSLATGNAPGQGGPIVDFECDTCGSSFDDRHRLMQHQSIHLELKRDWFTETPVEEVMRIFNRRRGEFLCNTCNLRFEATFDYDRHNHSVHGQRPYCCQFCGNGTRTFRFWRQYLNHLYDHRYIFSCTIDDCDFTVNRRDSLRFHIFRFHLNCQLPQQQQTIRSAGHQNMLQQLGDQNPIDRWQQSMAHRDDNLLDEDDDDERDDEKVRGRDNDDDDDDDERELSMAD